MKKFVSLAVLCGMILMGCAEPKRIGNEVVEPYGIFNKDEVKKPNVKYTLSPGSVIVAVLFSQTVIVPLYIVGWDLFEPVN